MKPSTLSKVFCRMGLALAFVSPAIAQTVTPLSESAQTPATAVARAALTTEAPADPDIVVLSPFTVSAEKERGYMASETLAGMRLRTELKDVGAAIDVLTEDFLNDVGAIDITDAIKYVANMEIADFPSTADLTNVGQAWSTQYFARGVVGNTVLTDFFVNGALPVDRYNTDNMTFMRGANSILFGIGSPSGMIGSSTKRASMGKKNATTLRFMFDKFGSRRFDFDSDITLLRNKLGIRVAGVLSDKQTYQTPSKNERNGLYLTASYKPFRKTKITVNAEVGEWNRYHPLNTLVADAYTPWVKAGKPTFNFVTGEGVKSAAWVATDSADNRKNKFINGVGTGLQGPSNGPVLVYIEGSGLPVMDWRNMPRGAQHNLDVPATATWTPGTMLEADRNKMGPGIPFTRENTIIDLDADIWGELNTNDMDYNRQTIFIEQAILPNLDIELAANRHYTEYLFNFFGQERFIFVDASAVLPDGSPNPYVGMPYIETGNNNNHRRFRSSNEYITYRATLSYELNLDKYKIFKNIGFGNYRFAGLWQRAERTERWAAGRFVNTTPLPGSGSNASYANNVNKISRRYYLQPGESHYRYDGTLPAPQPNSPGASSANDGPITIGEVSAESPRYNETLTDSLVFAVQSAWWFTKDGWPRITALYGTRRDEETKKSMSFTANARGEYPNAPAVISGITKYGDWQKPSIFKASTTAYNIMFRPLSPLRLVYNYSDIYVQPGSAISADLWGNPLDPMMGETEDFGVKLSLFNDRLNISAINYTTSIKNRAITQDGNITTYINAIWDAINLSENKIVSPRNHTYREDTTDGYEFSINARIGRSWNTRVAIGTQKTIIATTHQDWVRYFALHTPLWTENAEASTGNSSYPLVSDALRNARNGLNNELSYIGQQTTGQRDYNVSFTTTYGFISGFLKGLRIGATVRWESANNLSYAYYTDRPEAVPNISKPFKGPEVWTTDMNIGYSRRLFKGKVEWSLQLNVYNLLNDTDIRPRRATEDGSGNPVWLQHYTISPISYQLTNSFKF